MRIEEPLNREMQNARFHDFRLVLLAGGYQSRLSPLGSIGPKALICVDDAPLAQAIINGWPFVSAITIALRADLDDVASALAAWNAVSIAPATGTATGALAAAVECAEPYLVLVNADTLNELRPSDFLAQALSSPESVTVAVTRRRIGVQNAGMIAVGSDGHIVRSFEDQQPGHPPEPSAAWHGASMGLCSSRAGLLIETMGELSEARSLEAHVLPYWIRRGLVRAFDAGDAYTLDIGTPERLARLTTEKSETVRLLVAPAESGVIAPIDPLASHEPSPRRRRRR